MCAIKAKWKGWDGVYCYLFSKPLSEELRTDCGNPLIPQRGVGGGVGGVYYLVWNHRICGGEMNLTCNSFTSAAHIVRGVSHKDCSTQIRCTIHGWEKTAPSLDSFWILVIVSWSVCKRSFRDKKLKVVIAKQSQQIPRFYVYECGATLQTSIFKSRFLIHSNPLFSKTWTIRILGAPHFSFYAVKSDFFWRKEWRKINWICRPP